MWTANVNATQHLIHGLQSPICCLSCLGAHVWCGPCAVKAHSRLPFHLLQQWNGQFYDSITLQDLGFTLNLGHGGDVCPLNDDGPGDQLTVVDSAGIFSHTVRWCRCNGASDQDKYLQLLRCCLSPSSTMKPQMEFTFNVLNEFLIDELGCKTSATSFYPKLRRLTNNTFPDFLPVSLMLKHWLKLMQIL